MATVLYITAHPLDHQASYSMAVGKAFIEAYREVHASDEVVHLDLYQMNIPQLDADIFSGWGKLRSGTAFDQLSDAEIAAIATHERTSWGNTGSKVTEEEVRKIREFINQDVNP